jgi:hypothetical protein
MAEPIKSLAMDTKLLSAPDVWGFSGAELLSMLPQVCKGGAHNFHHYL